MQFKIPKKILDILIKSLQSSTKVYSAGIWHLTWGKCMPKKNEGQSQHHKTLSSTFITKTNIM